MLLTTVKHALSVSLYEGIMHFKKLFLNGYKHVWVSLYREEDMKMSENNDYIQLPPLKKDTPADVVAFMWEYMKVPRIQEKS